MHTNQGKTAGPGQNSQPPTSAAAVNGSEPNASRARFETYRQKVREKKLPQGSVHSRDERRSAKDRVRSAKELAWRFLQLLAPYRWQIFWILLSLTASTVIGLLPPAGTKFIVDY